MGTPINGVGGNVKMGANAVLNLGNWSVSAKANTSDTTSFQSPGGWGTKAATIKEWSGKSDGRTDPTDTTGQVALFNGLGNTFAVEFDIDGTHHWAGSAILTGIDPKADATGMNEASFSWDGTGPLTFT